MDLLRVNEDQGRYPASVYVAEAPEPAVRSPLDGNLRTDVCVIGAGYTGLSAALHLARRGVRVTVLDAQRIAWGASGRNGGQLGSGQRLDQQALEASFGGDTARKLWNLAEEAKALVRTLVEEYAIDCALKPGIVTADHKQRFVAGTRRYVEHLQSRYGYSDISFLDRAGLAAAIGTEVYFGGALDKGAGHLQPLAFARGIAAAAESAGAVIHENTRALSITPGSPATVGTVHGTVTADHVVVACNGYIGDLEPRVAARVMPINSYMIATEPLGEARARALIPGDVAVADSRFVVNYFRLSPDRRMLFGGRESYGYRYPDDIAAAVRRRMLAIYPQLADLGIDYAWGGTLGITLNRLPCFARTAPSVLAAAGFSGHGVGMATLAGKLMADAIHSGSRGFDLMASLPGRDFPGGQALRRPLLVMAMLYYALRDRL